MKRVFALVCICLVSASLAIAGGPEKKAATGAAAEKDPMAEMMSCKICKAMAPHMAEFGPVMTSEVVKMENGMAIIHHISDPKVVPTFQATCAEMSAAGKACMTMTEAEWKAGLCDHCEQIMGLVQSGAAIGTGNTKDGSMLVLTSADAATQTKIAGFEMQCEKMMSAMAQSKGM
ncbi:MAG TPA: hypothetical protein VFR10_10380 [bacterium]|nr:hypothetical protein [bacterium]